MLIAMMMVGPGFGLTGEKQQQCYRTNSFPHRGRLRLVCEIPCRREEKEQENCQHVDRNDSTERPTSDDGHRGSVERDDFSSNRHLALSFCLSMIFSENRCPLFRIML